MNRDISLMPFAKPTVSYVIYDKPADEPNHFVVRQWLAWPDGMMSAAKFCRLAKTLDEAHKYIPEGFENYGNFKTADPAICEVWIKR